MIGIQTFTMLLAPKKKPALIVMIGAGFECNHISGQQVAPDRYLATLASSKQGN